MKKIRKIICVFIACCMLTCMTGTSVSATNYEKYSSKKICWYIVNQKNHIKPPGAESSKVLKKFNAYYCDTSTHKKVMYLAFDCGYENGYTGKILDILKKNNVKATFFVTKQFVETNAKLCKRMKKECHLVGNHTMNHPSMPSKSPSDIRREVKGLESIFKKKTGYKLDKFIRPPMGEYSHRVLKLLKDMGYTTIFWSMAYNDYNPAKQPGKKFVVNYFKKHYHKGAITLTHNVSKSNKDALNDVIKYLKKKKYKMKLLTELHK